MNNLKSRTVNELALMSRVKSRLIGWAKFECRLLDDELPPLELEGYQDAAQNYEVQRQERIERFDSKQQS